MMATFEESRKRNQILGLLDPTGSNQTLLSMDLEKLKVELDKRTNSLTEYKHEDYFSIEDITTGGMNREEELALVKFRLSKKEEEIRAMAASLREKENELFLRERNLQSSERKLSKSPSTRRNEDSEFGNATSTPSRISGSPNSYQSFSYRRGGQVEETITDVIMSSIDNKSPEEKQSDNTLFGEMINGGLSERDAIIASIKESERIASSIIDKPFEDSSRIAEVRSIPIRVEKVTAESLRSEGKSPYYMLENRPEGATDEFLDNIYNMIVAKNYDGIKQVLGNKELNINILTWLRNLKYNDTTFKQMMLSKPGYFHKCLRPYE